MGLQRVGHDWATLLWFFTFMHWRRKWQHTPVFLPGESQGRRSLVGCRLWGHSVGHDWSDLAAAAAAVVILGFPGGSEIKASACNTGDLRSIPGPGRSPGEGNGNPLQYYCLENSMDGGAWWATVHGVANSRTRLSDFTFTFFQLLFYNLLKSNLGHQYVTSLGKRPF